MSITLLKKLRRAEAGLCVKCGRCPCECKTSQYLPKRKNGKRGKRKPGKTNKDCPWCKAGMVWSGGRKTCSICGAYVVTETYITRLKK
jgi:hypothetical protein